MLVEQVVSALPVDDAVDIVHPRIRRHEVVPGSLWIGGKPRPQHPRAGDELLNLLRIFSRRGHQARGADPFTIGRIATVNVYGRGWARLARCRTELNVHRIFSLHGGDQAQGGCRTKQSRCDHSDPVRAFSSCAPIIEHFHFSLCLSGSFSKHRFCRRQGILRKPY